MNPSDYPLALWPASASGSAVETDHLILAFTILTILLTAPVFLGITWFAIRYREGTSADRSHAENRNVLIELSWMIVPFLLTLIFFVWGARMYDTHRHAPPGAIEIAAIGRQWMWKFQHPGGQAEINNLHVPAGQPVVVRMISQDVIHALYAPALRIQMDTIPGRYTELWFKADRPGVYRLYCSEYCGTDHSTMGGLLTIMEPADYARWLAESGSQQSLASSGRALFAAYGCSGCHDRPTGGGAPALAAMYGHPVPLAGGGTVVADDSYVRAKILDPGASPMAGYKQTMPSFKGVVPEEDVTRLVAYVKSLSPDPTSQTDGTQTP